MKISLMLPSRGRPDMCYEAVASILETAAHPENIEIVVYTDDDDTSNYGRVLIPGVKLLRGARKKLAEYFQLEGCTGEIFFMANDDICFRTHGWDEKVLAAFEKYPDKIVAVYGEDGNPNQTVNIPFPFVHKNWVEVTGHLVPPIFSNNFVDTWISDIATMLGRREKIDIVTEHIHPDFGKRTQDQTDKDKWAKHWSENMPKVYEDSLPQREKEAAALRIFIGGSK
jgi:hypothetical protein